MGGQYFGLAHFPCVARVLFVFRRDVVVAARRSRIIRRCRTSNANSRRAANTNAGDAGAPRCSASACASGAATYPGRATARGTAASARRSRACEKRSDGTAQPNAGTCELRCAEPTAYASGARRNACADSGDCSDKRAGAHCSGECENAANRRTVTEAKCRSKPCAAHAATATDSCATTATRNACTATVSA